MQVNDEKHRYEISFAYIRMQEYSVWKTTLSVVALREAILYPLQALQNPLVDMR